jgi:hypothetical protein
MKGYCVKCRETRVMENPWTIKNKRNVPMMQATCGFCGKLVNTFVARGTEAPPDAQILSPGEKDGANHKEARPTKTKTTKTTRPPAAVDAGIVKREVPPVLPRKRERKQRKGKARRALQESQDEGLRQGEPVRVEGEGE